MGVHEPDDALVGLLVVVVEAHAAAVVGVRLAGVDDAVAAPDDDAAVLQLTRTAPGACRKWGMLPRLCLGMAGCVARICAPSS